MQFYWFFLGTLAVWRVSHLFTSEAGPWDVLDQLRNRLRSSLLQGLFNCFYCMSLWVAMGFALVLGETWKTALLLWPALSGGAIMLERLTSRAGITRPAPSAIYYEDQEETDDVLRQNEYTASNK